MTQSPLIVEIGDWVIEHWVLIITYHKSASGALHFDFNWTSTYNLDRLEGSHSQV